MSDHIQKIIEQAKGRAAKMDADQLREALRLHYANHFAGDSTQGIIEAGSIEQLRELAFKAFASAQAAGDYKLRDRIASRIAADEWRAAHLLNWKREQEARYENTIHWSMRPDNFDPERFKGDHEAFKSAIGHNEPIRGAYLFGESGTGKTRALAALYDRMKCEGPCEYWNAYELKNHLAAFRDLDEKSKFMDEMAGADFIFIDDFGHNISLPFLESLRLIIDKAADAMLFISAQYPFAALLKQARGGGFAEAMAAIIRRIDERCAAIKFTHSLHPKSKKAIKPTGVGHGL